MKDGRIVDSDIVESKMHAIWHQGPKVRTSQK